MKYEKRQTGTELSGKRLHSIRGKRRQTGAQRCGKREQHKRQTGTDSGKRSVPLGDSIAVKRQRRRTRRRRREQPEEEEEEEQYSRRSGKRGGTILTKLVANGNYCWVRFFAVQAANEGTDERQTEEHCIHEGSGKRGTQYPQRKRQTVIVLEEFMHRVTGKRGNRVSAKGRKPSRVNAANERAEHQVRNTFVEISTCTIGQKNNWHTAMTLITIIIIITLCYHCDARMHDEALYY